MPRDATAIIRPFVATTVGDGLGQYQANTWSGSAATVIGSGSSITADALGVTSSSSFCQYRSTSNGATQEPGHEPGLAAHLHADAARLHLRAAIHGRGLRFLVRVARE